LNASLYRISNRPPIAFVLIPDNLFQDGTRDPNHQPSPPFLLTLTNKSFNAARVASLTTSGSVLASCADCSADVFSK
jgi:hypothetical protein